MRWEILRIFKDSIAPFDSEINTVAIVGGFAEEPELIHLAKKKLHTLELIPNPLSVTTI